MGSASWIVLHCADDILLIWRGRRGYEPIVGIAHLFMSRFLELRAAGVCLA